MASAADDFLTVRVINVPVKLIFNFQVSVREKSIKIVFDFPYYLLAIKPQIHRDVFFTFHYFQHFC